MPQKLSQTGLRWLWLTLLVIVFDRIGKTLMLHFFKLDSSLRINKFFNLTLAYNKGAAFSFLNSAGGWQSELFGIIAIIVSMTLCVWLTRLSHRQAWTGSAISLILGGALGNLWDRIGYGHVIDFIQWHAGRFYWPVFNIADSAICIGAIMLVLGTRRPEKP